MCMTLLVIVICMTSLVGVDVEVRVHGYVEVDVVTAAAAAAASIVGADGGGDDDDDDDDDDDNNGSCLSKPFSGRSVWC